MKVARHPSLRGLKIVFAKHPRRSLLIRLAASQASPSCDHPARLVVILEVDRRHLATAIHRDPAGRWQPALTER